MIEREAVADAAATVVARHHEAPVPQRLHDLEAVPRHLALGIGEVLGVAGGAELAP